MAKTVSARELHMMSQVKRDASEWERIAQQLTHDSALALDIMLKDAGQPLAAESVRRGFERRYGQEA